MNKYATRRTGLALTLAVSCLLSAACGTTVASQLAQERVQRVVQDPDNPASRGYVAPAGPTDSASLIRDPENPYYTGAVSITIAPAVIRDPENPGWVGFVGMRFRSVNTQPCQPNDALCNEQ